METKQITGSINNGKMTINQARKKLGLKPIDNHFANKYLSVKKDKSNK